MLFNLRRVQKSTSDVINKDERDPEARVNSTIGGGFPSRYEKCLGCPPPRGSRSDVNDPVSIMSRSSQGPTTSSRAKVSESEAPQAVYPKTAQVSHVRAIPGANFPPRNQSFEDRMKEIDSASAGT